MFRAQVKVRLLAGMSPREFGSVNWICVRQRNRSLVRNHRGLGLQVFRSAVACVGCKRQPV